MRLQALVRNPVILAALVASWDLPAWGQLTAPWDKPPIPYRWDASGRACILAGPSYHAGAVAFSPHGSTLYVSEDEKIRRYDAKTGRELDSTVVGDPGRVHALAVSPDGRGLAVAVRGGKYVPPRDLIHLRRSDGTEVREFSQIPGQVIALAFAADGKTIGAIDHACNVRVWRVEDRGEVISSEVHRASGRRPDAAESRAGFSADLKRAVIVNDDVDVKFKDATWDNLVWLWDADAKLSGPFGSRGVGPVVSTLISPDGSQVVIALEHHNFFHFDVATGKRLRWHRPGNAGWGDEATFLRLSPDNRWLLSATKKGYLTVDELDNKLTGLHGFPGPYGHVRAAAIVPGGVRLATGGWDPLGAELIPGTSEPKYEPVLLWEVKVEGM